MSTALGGSASGQPPAASPGGAPGAGNPPEGGSTPPASGGSTPPPASGGDWRAALPEDIRDEPSLKSFSDIGNLAKSYVNAQKQIGKKGAIVPDWSKATDEEKSNFFKAIGVPDADKYEIKGPKDYAMPEAVSKQFKELAAKNGLLPQQAEAILGWYAGFETQSVKAAKEQQATAQAQGLETLKKEWGDAYDRELKAAQVAVKELGGDDFIKHLNQTGLGNDPTLIKIFAKAAKLMGEDKLREGGASDGSMTRSEIQSQIDDIRAQGDSNGFFDKSHPNHGVIMKKFESLAKQLTGGR